MELRRRVGMSGGLALVLAAAAGAQMPMRMPRLQGVWNPVVGAGAVYLMDSKAEGKRETEFAIVGKETVEGKTGHWLEMMFKDPNEGQMVVKTLHLVDENGLQVRRMVFQQGDNDPIEMPMEMMMGAERGKKVTTDFRTDAERVGTETVTTPAGSFTCEHYRAKDKSVDLWFSDQVPPYGMVRMTSREGTTVTLQRVLSNAKSRITKTPQKFDPTEMMRRQQP